MLTWLAIALGAAAGAPARFAVDRYCVDRFGTRLPYGTFLVNQAGCLILGVLTGLTLSLAGGQSTGWQAVVSLLGTGFCGALTTFSGWTSQIWELSRNPWHWRGTAYALLSIGVGFLLATAGYAAGVALG